MESILDFFRSLHSSEGLTDLIQNGGLIGLIAIVVVLVVALLAGAALLTGAVLRLLTGT